MRCYILILLHSNFPGEIKMVTGFCANLKAELSCPSYSDIGYLRGGRLFCDNFFFGGGKSSKMMILKVLLRCFSAPANQKPQIVNTKVSRLPTFKATDFLSCTG